MPWSDYLLVADRRTLEAVGMLRRRAYTAAAKVDRSAEPLLDPLDTAEHARILFLASADGAPVATARLLFPSRAEHRVEHDAHFPWPEGLPSRGACAEISRVAVEPALVRLGLGRSILMAAILDLVRRGRRFLVGSAAGRLLAYYQRIGCVPVGVSYRHATLGNLDHEVFYGDAIGSLLHTTGVSRAVWKRMFAPIYRQALAEQLVPAADY